MTEKEIEANRFISFLSYFYVACGGFIGAVVRALFFIYTSAVFAVLFVNIFGSFLIGFLMFFENDNKKRLFFGTGFLGSFTTFSTFMMTPFSEIIDISFIVFIGAAVFAGIFAAFIGKITAEKMRGGKKNE